MAYNPAPLDTSPTTTMTIKEGGDLINENFTQIPNLFEPKRFDNLSATTDPTITDDSSAGYEILSKWLNTTTGEIWLCTDNTIGAANWQLGTLTVDQLGSAALVDVGTGAGQIPVTGDYDPAGSAADAQAFSIQRANHTGTQPLSTISDAGTAATANIGTTSGDLIGTDEANDYYGLQYKPSVAPTLSSDFCENEHRRYEQYGPEPKTILQQWDVTRNSEATYFDANGVLQTAGINEPRIDYDPATGECRGLLVEGQSTRLNLYPAQFDNAAWIKSSLTVSANTSVAPDGLSTADKIIPSSGTVSPTLYQNVNVEAGKQYVGSVYIKKGEYGFLTLRWTIDGDNRFSVDLETGVFSIYLGSFDDVYTEEIKDGWWRVVFKVTPSVTASTPFRLIPTNALNSSTLTADGISGIYAWGAQFEQSEKTTSLILGDESLQVTRVADIITPTV